MQFFVWIIEEFYVRPKQNVITGNLQKHEYNVNMTQAQEVVSFVF